MPQGYCSLCGSFCELTFEHVPPRSAFNKKTRYKIVPFEKVLKSENILEANFSAKIEQGGLGYYSLCNKCNNFLGLNYVKSYSAYSNSFIEFAKKTQFNFFSLTMHDFEAAKVLKQIVSMFLSLNSWDFAKENPDLREYVLNPESKNLPQKIRVFSYLNSEGQIRTSTFSVIGNLKSSATILASEITFPPLGHVMTIDFKGHLPNHFELTEFKNVSHNELITTDFNLYRLPTYLPFPLDYRQKTEIEDVIQKNK
ncbi:hypothetical protein [Lacibacter sediminis]|uniref:HNH endonuclease n=1 Tax=Lacibacter sediminis TaxID=2760713 RepID=A0A7G5XGB3_9BACT|nr:hypothetical protein [Lacibacter sediminis]QNA44516.1 hypothetical protein H4075_21060 [Lacibacter sediminis]